MWCLFWYGFLLSSTVLTSPFWDKKNLPVFFNFFESGGVLAWRVSLVSWEVLWEVVFLLPFACFFFTARLSLRAPLPAVLGAFAEAASEGLCGLPSTGPLSSPPCLTLSSVRWGAGAPSPCLGWLHAGGSLGAGWNEQAAFLPGWGVEMASGLLCSVNWAPATQSPIHNPGPCRS